MEIIYLSKYFNENTYLVAGMCSKCYQENENVQIIAVNTSFLKKYNPEELKKINYLAYCNFNKDVLISLDNPITLKKSLLEKEKQKEKEKSPFLPPISPYNLIEEQLYHDPWKLLIATIFLNKTPLKTCKNNLEWFLNSFDSPEKLLETEISDLEKYFEPLGLMRRRAVQVYNMTHDYLFKNWKKVEDIYGIGDYGRDAYNMFCLGNFAVEPKDRYLRIYRNWYLKVYLGNETDFREDFYEAISQKEENNNCCQD